MKNIIFIGMPAVGKSTVGVVVAKRLGYEFIDTDLLIQKQENRLLREIIAEEGLDGFLSIENQVNRDVEAEHAVISPGGYKFVSSRQDFWIRFQSQGTFIPTGVRTMYRSMRFRTCGGRPGRARVVGYDGRL